ncbi:MAG: ATP phosphoribosyltransferase [bacterium]
MLQKKDPNRLRIAIQKSGRLTEKSLALLNKAGLQFATSKDRLFLYGQNMPVDLLLVRDDDIPEFLSEGICDLGLVGDNVLREHTLQPQQKYKPEDYPRLFGLGYGKCRLSIAISDTQEYQGLASLNGKTLATSYPHLLQEFFDNNNIKAQSTFLSGSVEIAPRLGTAHGICDLVSTGSTLLANQLKEVEVILKSEAALYAGPQPISAQAEQTKDRLLTRLKAIMLVNESKYVMFHAAKSQLEGIQKILPSAEAPTILPLSGADDRVAVHTLCRETVFWEHLEQLKEAGATAILVLPVEKMMV